MNIHGSELVDRLFATIVVPMRGSDLEVDEESYRSFVEYFCQPLFLEAAGGLIVNSEAGEIFYLDSDERARLLEIALETVNGRMPVFSGVAGTTTAGAVKDAVVARDVGADGLFVFPPIGALDVTYGWDATKYPEVWIDMVKAIVEAAPLPIIAHPIAPTTSDYGLGLPLSSTMRMVEEIPEIVGWKMIYPYGPSRRVARALRGFDRHVAVLAANSSTVHEAMASGDMDGLATGGLNYAMEPMVAHITAWQKGDQAEARSIWAGGLDALQAYVWEEWSRLHIRYEIATWLRGLITSPLMRPPLPLPLAGEVHTLARLLTQVGLDVIPDSDQATLLRELGRR